MFASTGTPKVSRVPHSTMMSGNSNHRKRRPKPFVSKQTRGITGKKQKTGIPSMPRHVKGPEQFYFRGWVWQTKKEFRDRVKALLRRIEGDGVEIVPHITTKDRYDLLFELVSRHPNFPNWGNKSIEAFRVRLADTKKSPPILEARFKGTPTWRNVRWMRCVGKTVPTNEEQRWSAMWYIIQSPYLQHPPLTPTQRQTKRTTPCLRCAANKLYIDNVHPSHSPHTPFPSLMSLFLLTREVAEPTHYEWLKRDNTFRFRPCDRPFADAWLAFWRQQVELVDLCEHCRIDDWVNTMLPSGQNSVATL